MKWLEQPAPDATTRSRRRVKAADRTSHSRFRIRQRSRSRPGQLPARCYNAPPPAPGKATARSQTPCRFHGRPTMRRTALLASLLVALSLGGLAAEEATPSLPRKARSAFDALDAGRIRAHLKFLASDLLEGRGTGQRGGEIAAAYIAAQFEQMGLLAGAVDGGYFHKGPLVGVTTGGGRRPTQGPAPSN